MMKLKKELTLPAVGLSGFETPLAEEEAAVQAGVHRFARDVMRPLGAQLDRMTADEVIAPGSPYYSIFTEYAKLGLDPAMLAELPAGKSTQMLPLLEEGANCPPVQFARACNGCEFRGHCWAGIRRPTIYEWIDGRHLAVTLEEITNFDCRAAGCLDGTRVRVRHWLILPLRA